jgi:hypothetical protein
MNEQIENKLEELFNSTPDNVGVMFGKKIKNGQYTEEDSIIFTVEEKKPLSELSESEILPSEVDIDGVIYKTDVFESGIIETFACPTNILDNCYGWQSTPPQNRQTIRPIKGGVSFTSLNKQGTVGTLGFLALDNQTGALVGVTNNHVVVSDAFYTSFRDPYGLIENEISDNTYQTGEFQPSSISLKIGEVIRYVPLLGSPAYNQVDGALTSINQEVFSNSESYKLFGLPFSDPLPFATTSEINGLIGNSQASSSGRTTGAKQGDLCGLKIQGISYNTNVLGYKRQGAAYSVRFNNCISFTRQNPECQFPIAPGDSGSALVANINGVTKIIGLVFAGSTTLGIASRIDFVSEQLGISAWNGETPKIIDISSKRLVTLPGTSSQKTIDCNGTTLWQVGLFSGIRICSQPTPSITPTQTNTPTISPSQTPTTTQTPTNTPTQTSTETPSNTPTQTQTPTPTQTPTNTATPISTNTPTQTQTRTSTPTVTQTNTPTRTQTKTPIPITTSTPTPTTTCVRPLLSNKIRLVEAFTLFNNGCPGSDFQSTYNIAGLSVSAACIILGNIYNVFDCGICNLTNGIASYYKSEHNGPLQINTRLYFEWQPENSSCIFMPSATYIVLPDNVDTFDEFRDYLCRPCPSTVQIIHVDSFGFVTELIECLLCEPVT